MGQRLDADAEHALQGEELADGEGAAALADLEPQRLPGHEERPGEAMRDPLRVETAGHTEHDVAELVGRMTSWYLPRLKVSRMRSATQAAGESDLGGGAVGQLPSIYQNPLVIRPVEAATSQAQGFLHGDVDLPGDVVVSSLRISADPEASDVGTADSHHDVGVLAALGDLGIQLVGDSERRIGREQATS